MIDRRALLAALACTPFASPAFAADGPDAVIAAIYQRIIASYDAARNNTDNGFFTWKKKARHQYYSASLAKAWDHADAITAKGDQNPPGACPITNSQDPLVRAFDVKVERQDGKTATVLVHISEKPGPVTPSDWGTIYYDMVLERGRWRIDDIRPGIGKDAWSLRQEIVNHKG
jgi:hypothetical protein